MDSAVIEMTRCGRITFVPEIESPLINADSELLWSGSCIGEHPDIAEILLRLYPIHLISAVKALLSFPKAIIGWESDPRLTGYGGEWVIDVLKNGVSPGNIF
jgi:hypothetical protein